MRSIFFATIQLVAAATFDPARALPLTPPPRQRVLALRGGGGPTLPQGVLAVSGSALSISGIAALLEYVQEPSQPPFGLSLSLAPMRA